MSRYLDLAKGLIPSPGQDFPCEKSEISEITSPPLTPAESLHPVPAPPAPPGSLVTLLRIPAGCPDGWADGVARLLSMPPPRGYAADEWATLKDDAAGFFWRWAGEAALLGWDTLAVWGVHPTKPRGRLDCMGLVPALRGRRVSAMTADAAAIDGLRFYRPRRVSDAVPLWNLK